MSATATWCTALNCVTLVSCAESFELIGNDGPLSETQGSIAGLLLKQAYELVDAGADPRDVRELIAVGRRCARERLLRAVP